MIEINIDNQIKAVIPKDFKKQIDVFLDTKLPNFSKKIILGISFVNAKKIQNLNATSRNIDKPTDVLSFPIYQDMSDIKKSPATTIELGDIVICPEIAQKHIDDYHLSTDLDILTFLALHGLKHLVGIHHK